MTVATQDIPLESATLDVSGMTCASCISHVRKAASTVRGVQACEVNLARGTVAVQFDPQQTKPLEISQAISSAGYLSAPREAGVTAQNAENERAMRQAGEADAWFLRALVGLLLWLPLEVVHWTMQLLGHHHPMPAQQMKMAWASLLAATIAMLYVGSRFFVSAFRALRMHTSNMDTLISLGASVAYGYSLAYFAGGVAGIVRPPTLDQLYFMEASGLLTLISLGHWLEARARRSAGSAIRQLLDLTPPMALILDEKDDFHEIAAAELQVGDRVLIRPGNRVPADGVVTAGRSSVDESMMTGESLPVVRTVGDEVFGGTINVDGRLFVRVTRTGAQTALAQIVQLVENAQSGKPPIQRLADRVSAVFVPSVLGIALLTAIGWYAWGTGHHWAAGATWGHMANAVCSVLIIACPCALGLAVPTALMVGTGRGARRGILIRNIDALQKAEAIQTVVLDKTGTITEGRPVVRQIVALDGRAEDEVLGLAASVEQFSEHPLARAITAAARQRGLTYSEIESFTNEPGLGVVARSNGQTYLVGNHALLQAHGDVEPESPAIQKQEGTRVYVAAKNGDRIRRLGVLLIADRVKDDSASAVAELERMRLGIVLLTGDHRDVAESVGRQAGIDRVHADVRPGEKAAVIKQLQNQHGAHVAMVGDGINDAPALAQADLGIAIGSGSDVAKEAGDIVLVGESLSGVATAIRLSRATMRKIRQNLFLAFIYNVLAIPLAASGRLNPLIAAAAMALSDITVVGNALLLRRANIDGSRRYTP